MAPWECSTHGCQQQGEAPRSCITAERRGEPSRAHLQAQQPSLPGLYCKNRAEEELLQKPGQADGAKKHHGKIFNSHQTRTLAVSEPAPPAALEQPHPQGLQHLGAFPRDKGVAQQEKSALSELSARYQRWISQLAETRWFQDQQQFWLCMESPGRRG